MVLTVSKGKEPVTLINLKGYSRSGVEDYAKEHGLKLQISEENSNETADTVIKQSPAEGTALKKGDTLTVVISKGKGERVVSRQFTIPYEAKKTNNNNNNNGKNQKNSYSNLGNKEKKQPSKVKHVILALLAIIFIVVGAFFAYNYIVGADSVSAPEVRNKTLEEAKVTIVKAGLEVGDVTEVASDDVKENTVIDSDPKAGKKVRKGSKVDLRVSSGKKTVDMPNYVGLDEDTAKRNASKLGFKNVTVEKVESNNYDSGKVVAQNISAGSEIVPKEKELILQVSSGKKKVTMPNLVNQSSQVAQSTIASYGFRNVTYKEEYSDKEAGTVISQSIRSGASIVPGEESLEIVISKGKKPSTNTNTNSNDKDDSSNNKNTNNSTSDKNNTTNNNSNNNNNSSNSNNNSNNKNNKD